MGSFKILVKYGHSRDVLLFLLFSGRSSQNYENTHYCYRTGIKYNFLFAFQWFFFIEKLISQICQCAVL